MGRFLRDQQISDVTLDEVRIKAIGDRFVALAEAVNAAENDVAKQLIRTYILRFDNKGHRFYSIDELLTDYAQAQRVERIIFTMETMESRQSNRLAGRFVELKLAVNAPNDCFFTVSAEDANWVDAVFASITELIARYKNRHNLVRNAFTVFLVQLFGVILGFALCLWGASRIAPSLNIDNAFPISFLFLLLLFSNIWGHLNQLALRALLKVYPNVLFTQSERDRWPWLARTLIGGMIVAGTLFLLGKLFGFLGSMLSGFLK